MDSSEFSEGEESSLAHARYPAFGLRSASGDKPQPGCGSYTGSNVSAGRLSLRTSLGTVAIDPSVTVWGEYLYSADLPVGSVTGGALQVRSAGTGTIDPFVSEVLPIKAIQILTDLRPGTVLKDGQPLTIAWSGGTKDIVVNVKILSFSFPGGERLETGLEAYELGDVGSVTVQPIRPLPNGPPILPIAPGAGVVVTIRAMPAVPEILNVKGISLGVKQVYEQAWEFHGLSIGR